MAKASASPAAPASFETALMELESIVQTMEGGRLPLEDSLSAYQRGMLLLKFCQEALVSAEQKVKILENGALRDFSHESDASSENNNQ